MELRRFALRRLEPADAVRMLEWMRDADITRYLQIGGSGTTEERVLGFIQGAADESESFHRAIADAAGEYLGTVSLKHIDREKGEAEYAISMHPSALGTGAAAEGSRQILRLAFEELGLRRVYLNVLEENRRAVKFYNKIGFRYTHATEMEYKGENKTLLWYEATPGTVHEGD